MHTSILYCIPVLLCLTQDAGGLLFFDISNSLPHNLQWKSLPVYYGMQMLLGQRSV